MAVETEIWKTKPEPHDYPAAEDYLALLMAPAQAKKLAAALKKQVIVTKKAKDILRASRLSLLQETNPHVRRDLKKIKSGAQLSPVLLVRGDAKRDLPLLIADGYHRICASWYVDEDAAVPCQIAELQGAEE